MVAMIARTDYHNISGTRCSTDFVELPSVLMEHFCQADSVLPLFARHYLTDAPLQPDLLRRHLKPVQAFHAMSTRYQIMLSVLDMTYHTMTGNVNTTAVCHEVFKEYSLFPALPPDSKVTLQTSFTHLFPYGASYYSYLFDRAIAAKVWKDVFEDDPLSREAGEKYLQEVLKWGGGRDGWECVAGVLGQDDLKAGRKEAMERVGQWGIERQ
jgi:mitochondrial intermediate peptidase